MSFFDTDKYVNIRWKKSNLLLPSPMYSLVCFSIQLIDEIFLFRRHMKKFVLQLKKLPMVYSTVFRLILMMKLFQLIWLLIHIYQYSMLKLVIHSMTISLNLFHGMFSLTWSSTVLERKKNFFSSLGAKMNVVIHTNW